MASKEICVASAAAETIGGNCDLVAEILRRLPAKSLFQFKSVCKPWYFLLSSPAFRLLHYHFHHQHPYPNLSGFFLSSTKKPEFMKFIHVTQSHLKMTTTSSNGSGYDGSKINEAKLSSVVYAPRNTTIVDSCNGHLLVCTRTNPCTLASHKFYSVFNPFSLPSDIFYSVASDKFYSVYNPTLKQCSTLPWPFPGHSTLDILCLVFDPAKSKSPHYKVVLLKCCSPHNAFHWGETHINSQTYLEQIHIYSSQTRLWGTPSTHRPSPTQLPLSFQQGRGGLYCDGYLHCISDSPKQPSTYIDVEEERFCEMPSPPPFFGGFRGQERLLRASKDRLHIIDSTYGCAGYNVEVLEMETRDHSNWSVKYRVCLNSVVKDYPHSVRAQDFQLSLISLIQGEDEGDVFLVVLVGANKILFYNIKDNTYNKFDIASSSSFSDEVNLFKSSRVDHYFETFFPV